MTFEGFNLDDNIGVKTLEPKLEMPFIRSVDEWKNYTNEMLYDVDKWIREWMQKMHDEGVWVGKRGRYNRYSVSTVFTLMTGMEYEYKHTRVAQHIGKVLSCYSSRRIKATEVHGKTCRNVYALSYTIMAKTPPVSLKLRLEWLAERGELPTAENMRLSKGLKPGTAYYPITNARMKKRQREARDRYNEYQYRKKAERESRQ